MNTPNPGSPAAHQSPGTPAWASWIGFTAIVLGVYLTAAHGNQLMKHWVLSGPASFEIPGYTPNCPEDELEEEGISLEMCLQKTANSDTVLLARPDWFRSLQIVLMTAGTVIAFVSIFAGVALVENRSWATRGALITFAALVIIDALGFLAVINTGPLLRQMYLWSILLWFIIHLLLFTALLAASHEEASAVTGELR